MANSALIIQTDNLYLLLFVGNRIQKISLECASLFGFGCKSSAIATFTLRSVENLWQHKAECVLRGDGTPIRDF